jgi:purine-binding chemotaxis protein CheW
MVKSSAASQKKNSATNPRQPAQAPTPATKVQKGHSATRQIDWDAIRQRISQSEASNASVMDTDSLSEEALQAAWDRRTHQLAAVVKENDQGEQIEIAVIRLGRELYGLGVEYIFDIRPLESITRVPRVPDWVAGVVNLRGKIISVVDLLAFLGLATNGHDGADRYLLMVQTPNMELALLADEVLAIESLPVSQIQEAGTTVRGLRPEYVRGLVVRQADDAAEHAHAVEDTGTMVLLDLPVLLSDPALIIREEIA